MKTALGRALSTNYDKDKVPVPWQNLAEVIDPHAGNLIVCLGAPGAGKSAFALNWVLKVSLPSLVLSLDTDITTQAVRTASLLSGTPMGQVKNYAPGWSEYVDRIANRCRMYDLLLEPKEIAQLVKAETEFWGKPPALTVVDNVSNLIKEGGYEEYRAIFTDLHRVARITGTCILALHHIKRGTSTGPLGLFAGQYCVEVDTPVLCADLYWRAAGELTEGMEVIAFTEHGHPKRFETATVTRTGIQKDDCYEVETEHGVVVANAEHKWLVAPKRPGFTNTWKSTLELTTSDKLQYMCEPWQYDTSREAGWLAGMYDGEGWVGVSNSDKTPRHWKMGIAQNPGPVLDELIKVHDSRSYKTSIKTHASCRTLSILGGRNELLRLLGSIRPQRLLDKPIEGMWEGMGVRGPNIKKSKVISIKPVGQKEIATISTSSGTLITNGFLSHNSGEQEAEMVLGLWSTSAGTLNISVDKNRSGMANPDGSFYVNMQFDKETMRIEEPSQLQVYRESLNARG